MKKIIITSLFLLGIISQNCFGQLKVDSLGHVAVGTLNTTNSLLTIGQGYGNSIYTATITPPTGKGGLYIQNPATSSSPLGNVGLSITNNNNLNTSSYGIQINWNHLDGYSSPKTYSIYTEAGGSSVECYGVAATLFGIGSAYGAAIIGSTSSSPTLQHSGQYAGYFKGDVRSTGTIYSALLSPSPISSSSTVKDLTEDRANDISSKISSLQPIAVIYENEQRNEDVVQTKMSSTRYAIDEESLRNLFPELVYEDMDGNVSINYIEMVPLLVQSIKELNAKIEELQGNDVKAVRNRAATSVEGTEADLFSISQNEPNPFTESTTIKLSIPKKTRAAALIIYDMSGKQINQINITERGKTSVNITSEGLAAGMYLYSLVADGKVISTKRMILTK